MKKKLTQEEAQAISDVMRTKRERLNAEAISMAKAAIDGGFDYAAHPCIVAEIDALWPAWRSFLEPPVVGGGQGRDPWDMEGRGRSNVIVTAMGLAAVVVGAVVVGWVVFR